MYRVTINAGRDDNLCSEAEKIKSSIEEKYKTKLSLQLPIKSGYRFYNVSFKNLSIVVSCDSLFSDGPYPKTTTDILDPILSEAADEHMKKSHEKIKKESLVKVQKICERWLGLLVPVHSFLHQRDVMHLA